MARGKASHRLGWSGDFRFQWAPAAECEVATAEYDHYRSIFGRTDPYRSPDAVSLYEARIQDSPRALAALVAGKRKTSWHRVVRVYELGRPYEPLRDVPDLFLRFGELGRGIRKTDDISRRESLILGWVKKYGTVGTWHAGAAPRVLGDLGSRFIIIEPVEYFVDEALRMAFLADLYEALTDGDEVKLADKFRTWFSWRKVVDGVEFRAQADPLYLVVGAPQVCTVWPHPPANHRERVFLGLQYLANTAGQYVSGEHVHSRHGVWPEIIGVKLLEYADEKLEPMWEIQRGWSCSTLLTAMYVQFLDVICRKRQTAICGWCGRWFVPGKAGARFCSSKCRSEHDYAKVKRAKQMYEAGTPVSEIAKALGMSRERVRALIGEHG